MSGEHAHPEYLALADQVLTSVAELNDRVSAIEARVVALEPKPQPPTELPARLGVGMKVSGESSLLAIEAWLGAPLRYASLSPNRRTPSTASIRGLMLNRTDLDRNLGAHADRVTFEWTYAPMFYGDEVFNAKTTEGRAKVRDALLQTVSGRNDEGFFAIASTLVEVGQSDAIIRLGHEMTGTWFQWSAVGNEDVWIPAYRRVVEVMHSVSPDFRFFFCMAGSQNNAVLGPRCYPGDDVVDIIGGDIYDRGAADTYFDPAKPGWRDPALVWREIQRPWFDAMRRIAIEHGKPFAIGEWGLEGTAAAGGIEGANNPGGDNPYFVQAIHDALNEIPRGQPGGPEYHSYFWADPEKEGPHKLSDPSLPNGA